MLDCVSCCLYFRRSVTGVTYSGERSVDYFTPWGSDQLYEAPPAPPGMLKKTVNAATSAGTAASKLTASAVTSTSKSLGISSKAFFAEDAKPVAAEGEAADTPDGSPTSDKPKKTPVEADLGLSMPGKGLVSGVSTRLQRTVDKLGEMLKLIPDMPPRGWWSQQIPHGEQHTLVWEPPVRVMSIVVCFGGYGAARRGVQPAPESIDRLEFRG